MIIVILNNKISYYKLNTIMSNLYLTLKPNLTYKKSGCAGFVSRKYPGTVPIIYYVSSQYVNDRGVYFINILGENFRDYSIVQFGPNIVRAVFLNSQLLLVYIDTNYPVGTYTVQVFNDLYSSNIVNVSL